MNSVNKKRKRAQITIFVILALLIAVVLIVMLNQRVNLKKFFVAGSPVEQVEDCVQEMLKNNLETLSIQGGTFNPAPYYMYKGEKVQYLCYTEEDRKSCIVQKPMLKKDIEKELKELIEPEIDRCLESVKSSSERRGYTINYKKPVVSVEIVPENVLVDVESDMQIIKGESTESYKKIRANRESELYKFAMIASAITNWEVTYGDIESLTFMLNHPSLKVEKKIQSDGTRIYILTSRDSGEKFTFASRSFAIPPGIVDTNKGVTR